MSDLIEPSHFDAVLISSGLPEVLIASALARAGKAVLLLDAADTYGSSWASLSGPDFVHQLISSSLAHGHAQQQPQAHKHAQQQPQAQASDTDAAPSPLHNGSERAVRQQLQLALAGAQGCSLYTHPSLEQALDNKGLIIDLAPRVLYQDEALVQLLVSCQAHNYLEFKLVEGNYVLSDGQLQPVPASRADLFADRALSLADKRSLGRFMAACVEAAEGSGRLKDAFDGRPLVQLLAAEGLNQRLQQLVLYGIAMADTPQQEQQLEGAAQQQSESNEQHEQQPSAAPSSSSAATHPAEQQPHSQQPQQQPQPSRLTGQLTAADGLSAFVLYSRSLGRFGGSGALMTPCYGCGSLSEAFVRLAAIKGAVTALRQPTRAVQLLPEPTEPEQAPGAQPAAAQQGVQQQEAQDSLQQAGGVDAGAEQLSDAAPAPASAAGPVATAPARLRLTLASGQAITAGHVVSCSSSLTSADDSSTSSRSSSGASSTPVVVARAVAVLDGSLVQGDTSLTFVIPPGTLGPQQAAVIRGLQLGHALAVAPPGHCLLYLAAVLPQQQQQQQQLQQEIPAAHGTAQGVEAAGCSTFAMQSVAEQVLGPALAAVAATQHLQAAAVAAAAAADTSNEVSSSSAQQQQDGQAQQQDGTSPARHKPQVLAACFYTMQQAHKQQQQQQQGQPSTQCSSYLVQCQPAPAAGFAGYSSSISAAEALYRQHFADLPWLTDPLPQQQQQQQAAAAAGAEEAGSSSQDAAAAGPEAGGAAAAAAAAAVLDDDELDAIDELTAALAELSSGLDQGLPGQGSAAAPPV